MCYLIQAWCCLQGFQGVKSSPRGPHPSLGAFMLGQAMPGHAGVPLSLARAWCWQVPPSSSPPWLPWGQFCPLLGKEEEEEEEEGFPCAVTLTNHLFHSML